MMPALPPTPQEMSNDLSLFVPVYPAMRQVAVRGSGPLGVVHWVYVSDRHSVPSGLQSEYTASAQESSNSLAESRQVRSANV